MHHARGSIVGVWPPRSFARAARGSVLRASSMLLCALILFAQDSAAAQSTRGRAGEPPGYRATINEALDEYDAGNFAEARALFNTANELYPNARALRGLGMTEFELRNYVESVAFLEQALESRVHPLERDLRAETLRLLERARAFVAQFDLMIDPPDATVVVDGAEVVLGPQPRLVLQVGDHLLEFSAPGRLPEKRVLKIRGREQQVMRVTLAPEPVKQVPLQVSLESPPVTNAAPPAAMRADADEPTRRPAYMNPWLWIGVGVAVAAVGVGLGFGLMRRDPTHADAIASDPAAALVGP